MASEAQDVNGLVEGKAAVRLHLIDRLEAAGMTRPRRMGVEAFEAGKKHLTERLAYMSVENLQVLADALIDTAASNEWPSEIVMMQLARGIQTPPPAQSRALTSWLASVEGPKAVAGGYLVDLFRFIRHRLRPPTPFEMREIGERAREHDRRRQIIQEKIRAEMATDDDRNWLMGWMRDEELALALVDEGNKKRAGAA
jgi:hypothetical protein